MVSFEVKLGSHSLTNARSINGYDSVLGDFVSIMYDVSIFGIVKIRDGTLIGCRTVILPGVKIDKNWKIGADVVVTKNIPDNSIAVGVSAIVKKTI